MDMGVDDPEDFRTRALLLNEIAVAVDRLGTAAAAARTGVAEAELVRIIEPGNLRAEPLWRLFQIAAGLGFNILITVSPSGTDRGRIHLGFEDGESGTP